MRELIASVKQHEGFRTKAYKDSLGVWTIGYGTNLQVLEVTEPQASEWLIKELTECLKWAYRIAEYDELPLSEQRIFVIAEMAYNIGRSGTLRFVKMFDALKRGEYGVAADEMLNSRWAKQVGQRAVTLADRMRRNVY